MNHENQNEGKCVATCNKKENKQEKHENENTLWKKEKKTV